MTREHKKLLLVDLSARLPYDVKVNYVDDESQIYILTEVDPACKDIDYITVRIQDVERFFCAESVLIENIKPYLRPMSSMTEEERNEYKDFIIHKEHINAQGQEWDIDCFSFGSVPRLIDWLNKNHFDYRGLIEKGLAIEAPKEMYN